MQASGPVPLWGLCALLAAGASGAAGAEPVSRAGHAAATESRIFTLDRVYRSMFGPKHTDSITLGNGDEGVELLWITAIRADVVAADGETPQSPEYFCHSVFTRVNPRPARLVERLGLGLQRPKMFTLVQGQSEIRFPEGFGMPVFSRDRFDSTVMVMNPVERAQPVQVGVDSRIEYLRDSELTVEMKPLFLVPLVTKVPVEGEGSHHAGHAHAGEDSCLDEDSHPKLARSVDQEGHVGEASPVTLSEEGMRETGHWYVPPGRHVYRHRLGRLDDRILFDTRAHYIAAHLHPYGESLELVDLTTGESVFKATARNYPDRMAVQEVTHYASPEGLPINRHHDHEIVAVYDNTSGHEVDSMAVMYLYLHDRSAPGATGG